MIDSIAVANQSAMVREGTFTDPHIKAGYQPTNSAPQSNGTNHVGTPNKVGMINTKDHGDINVSDPWWKLPKLCAATKITIAVATNIVCCFDIPGTAICARGIAMLKTAGRWLRRA